MSCPVSKLSINHVDIQTLLVSIIHPSLSIHPFPSLLAQLFSIDSGTLCKMAVSKRPRRQSAKVSFEFRAGMMAIATPISLGLSWPQKQIATEIGTGVEPSILSLWHYGVDVCPYSKCLLRNSVTCQSPSRFTMFYPHTSPYSPCFHITSSHKVFGPNGYPQGIPGQLQKSP